VIPRYNCGDVEELITLNYFSFHLGAPRAGHPPRKAYNSCIGKIRRKSMRVIHKMVLGCLLWLNLGGTARSASSVRQTSPPSNAHAISDRKSRFAIIGTAEIVDDQGIRSALTTFQTKDGTALSLIHHECETRPAAEAYLGKMIGKAKKIVQRNEKKNKHGKIIGERAEVISSDAAGHSLPEVMWTDGSDYREITSQSRSNILILEKQLTP
jgi:hypothetical protein